MAGASLSRLRWRRRGAWMWPAFGVLTVVDGILLWQLPFLGDGSPLVAGLLIAGFANLVIVAAVAPLAGLLVRRRRPSLPSSVAWDRAGVALLVAMTAILLAGGLAHRPAVVSEEDEFRMQAAFARAALLREAPAPYRANLDRADVWKLGPDLYRTCAPRADGQRAFCVIVDTTGEPPAVRVDPNRAPNSLLFGPGGPWGR